MENVLSLIYKIVYGGGYFGYAGHLRAYGAALFKGSGDVALHAVHHRQDIGHSVVNGGYYAVYVADIAEHQFVGGFRFGNCGLGMLREGTHFLRDDRESLSVLAGAGGFNACVDGEYIYLAGDIADVAGHF